MLPARLASYAWGVALPYQPVDGKTFRVTMGLRALDPADWIEVDQDFAADLALKRTLLAERPGDVLGWTAEGHDPAVELLEILQQHLARHFPELPHDAPVDLHPVDAAGRLVQEDLCVLTHDGRDWVLVAASVCFPSRWTLTEKIGRSLAHIHDPVPGYPRISAATDGAFDRLTPQRPMWRLNWSLMDDSALFQTGHHRPVVVDRPGDMTFRVERQTLRKLPQTGAVVFTIRTYRASLAELVEGHPQTAAAFASTLRSVALDTRAYKGLTDSMPAILEYLESVS